jgi:hypothetical protein
MGGQLARRLLHDVTAWTELRRMAGLDKTDKTDKTWNKLKSTPRIDKE